MISNFDQLSAFADDLATSGVEFPENYVIEILLDDEDYKAVQDHLEIHHDDSFLTTLYDIDFHIVKE